MPSSNCTAGEIRADSIYTLEDFMARVGFGRHAMRAARRRGLHIRREGNRAYVVGADWLAYLTRVDNETRP